MTDSTPQRRGAPSADQIDDFVPQAGGGREARLGIFVILGLLSFVTVLFLLTDPATLRGRYILHTIVEDAGGVRRGDPIQMRGVNVGRIHGFEMDPSGTVTISLELEGEWPVPVGSRTRLGAAGMFGGRTVEILPTDAAAFHTEGDTLPGEGGSSGGLLGSVDDLSEQAGTVLGRIEALLDTQTVGSVQGSARELETLLTELSALAREQKGALEGITLSLRRSADGLEQASAAGPDVARAVARADSAIATLSDTGEKLDAAAESLRTLLARIDRGEGTLGRLSTDSALYDNMNLAAERLASLLEDLQANPRKYINLSIF